MKIGSTDFVREILDRGKVIDETCHRTVKFTVPYGDSYKEVTVNFITDSRNVTTIDCDDEEDFLWVLFNIGGNNG